VKYLKGFNENGLKPYHDFEVKDTLNDILVEIGDIPGLKYNIAEGPLPDCNIICRIESDSNFDTDEKEFKDCLLKVIDYMKSEGYRYKSRLCWYEWDIDNESDGENSCELVNPFDITISSTDSLEVEFIKIK
jgi:hypothetical protein